MEHLRLSAIRMAMALLLALGAVAASAQAAPQHPPVRAVFVSDIHFEPFWDPGKAARLAVAPESKWTAILASPESPHRRTDFDALQVSCHARGTDTSYGLLASSIGAMRAHAAGVAFVLMSGDLLAHSFDCKYHALFPHAQPSEYSSFVEKTIRFVMEQLESVAPRVPVYATLGNNDSDCGDYRGDAHSAFLKSTALTMTRTFPRHERSAALRSFSANGSYSIALPAPMRPTRLIVVDDVMLSAKHTTCGGRRDAAEQQDLLAWLSRQIEQARAEKQKVWIMGHIPPGIDAYATLAHITGACRHRPTMLLSSGKFAETLAGAGDVITLAIFGHTHEDEIELLQDEAAGRQETSGERDGDIPVKIVPSISPVNGNEPSFTVAQVDAASATLLNYQVIAGDQGKPWAETYDFAKAYGTDSFSAVSVARLVEKFAADPNGKSHDSREYIHNFLTGSSLPLLSLVWPQYVCTLDHQTAAGFTVCACKGK
jgi:sphingomyelin phosphodiesterase acid-like 3